MKHETFSPKTFEQGKHTVVGDCNGVSMQDRWEKETPVFAKRILEFAELRPGFTILDYGCGVGRISKEIIKQANEVTVFGLDASSEELKLAKEYVNDSRFIPVLPHELCQQADLIYSIYCLQHVPAIELREVLQRIHTYLKDDGLFIYCSSDYRMAARFDAPGFFDDRFLGVNIREEISRFFNLESNLFTKEQIDSDPVLAAMIENRNNVPGGIPHPALVFKRKHIHSYLFNAQPEDKKTQAPALGVHEQGKVEGKRKLILRNRLSPGDILVMSAAIRSIQIHHPGKFEIDVDTPCNDIFLNSKYITNLNGEGQIIDMNYPLISDHKMRGFDHPGAGVSGRHFSDGHRKYLEEVLEIEIPRSGLLPDIFLSQDEKLWPSPVFGNNGYEGKYWVINAGSKDDYQLKQYHRWQEVVNLWAEAHPDIKLVQVGQTSHNHPSLEGILDMRGKTNLRELFRLIYKAEGVLTCVSLPMHAAAALEKPCVVVAGGRESTRWELYPNHRFLYTNGALDCCLHDGCWKSKLDECFHVVDYNRAPLCMELIRPEDIVRAMELYYLGGVLKMEEMNHA